MRDKGDYIVGHLARMEDGKGFLRSKENRGKGAAGLRYGEESSSAKGKKKGFTKKEKEPRELRNRARGGSKPWGV